MTDFIKTEITSCLQQTSNLALETLQQFEEAIVSYHRTVESLNNEANILKQKIAESDQLIKSLEFKAQANEAIGEEKINSAKRVVELTGEVMKLSTETILLKQEIENLKVENSKLKSTLNRYDQDKSTTELEMRKIMSGYISQIDELKAEIKLLKSKQNE